MSISYQLFGISSARLPAQGVLTLPSGSDIAEAIRALGISAEVCLFVRNGRVARLNDRLDDGDQLRLVGPVDGGS